MLVGPRILVTTACRLDNQDYRQEQQEHRPGRRETPQDWHDPSGGQLVMRAININTEETVLEWIVHEHLMRWPTTLVQKVRYQGKGEGHFAEEYRVSRQNTVHFPYKISHFWSSPSEILTDDWSFATFFVPFCFDGLRFLVASAPWVFANLKRLSF